MGTLNPFHCIQLGNGRENYCHQLPFHLNKRLQAGIGHAVKATVLIVDDSTFIVEGLVAILQRSYRAIPSFSGEECISILGHETPDVIVLDIMMEPMDGWETLARIKENPATRTIPVLMFTAKKITPEEAETHRVWIGDVLIKPVSPKELISAIEKLLERDRRNKAIVRYLEDAGIPRTTIDAYVTRSANLEVDRSLLATLQKVSPHNPEIPTGVLQDRILRGKKELNDLLSGTGLTVEFLNSLPALPGEPDPLPSPVIVTTGPITPDPAGEHKDPSPALPRTADTPAEPVPDVPVPGSELYSPSPDREQIHNASDTVTKWDPVPDVPVLPGYFPAPETPASGPEPAKAPPRQEPAENDHVAWIPIPSHADPLSHGYSPGTEALFEPERVVPMPPIHIQKPAATADPEPAARPAVPPMHRPAPPRPEPGHQGLFSRIVAAIRGLFSRKK